VTPPFMKGAPRWVGTLVFPGSLLIVALVFHRPLLAWFAGSDRGGTSGGDATAQRAASPVDHAGGEPGDSDGIHHYTCAMHPSVKQQTAGKCPICGMDLTPVTNVQQEQGVVMVDEARRQLIGVRIEPVIEAPMQRTIRAVGRVTYDESALADVSLKVRGWVTELFVNQTGQHIRRGQPLFRVYSPELYSAEQDFLLATRRGAGNGSSPAASSNETQALQRAGRLRLNLLGVTDAQIDELAQRGVPSKSIEFSSPATGFVIEKDVVQGAAVEAGMRLYRIAALDEVWIEADVYESDLLAVRVGQPASVSLDYLPGRTYSAKVAYIYPALDPMARTARVRLVLGNEKRELRPGMYASVSLVSDMGRRVQVPASAVVYTGPRRLVFVDVEEGRFRPQEVRLGTEANGMFEVLSGLAPGERVATSGVFLIAAEARITTAARYWDKADDPVGMPPATVPDPTPSEGASSPRPRPVEPASASPAPAPLHSPSAPRAQPRTAVEERASKPSSPDPVFTCPMHPEVRRRAPGKCPKCGMTLEPAAPMETK
jgi:membrane fusion protein, copper/silver efflux system